MIQPTVGIVVHLYRNGRVAGKQPLAGIITLVHNEACVNLATFLPNGEMSTDTHVHLRQEGEVVKPGYSFCERMPYQVGQAAETEELSVEGDAMAIAGMLIAECGVRVIGGERPCPLSALIEERSEIEGRMRKLVAFQAAPEHGRLLVREQESISKQFIAMRDYSRILSDRISNFV